MALRDLFLDVIVLEIGIMNDFIEILRGNIGKIRG